MPAHAPLHIHLLGGFRLEREGRPLPAPASKRARLLLAYLLLHAQHEHERIFLAGLLWPDLPESKARRRLSQALWQVKQMFAGVESGRNRVRIQPQARYQLDVQDFRAALQRAASENARDRIAAWEEAIDLYSGPLLPGFYDDWTLILREQLREHYLRTLEQLIAEHKGTGCYEQALSLARRLTVEEPLNEEAHGQVIRLYALLGRRKEALLQYDMLRQILADELGVAPGSAIERLAQQVRRQTLTPAGNDDAHTHHHAHGHPAGHGSRSHPCGRQQPFALRRPHHHGSHLP